MDKSEFKRLIEQVAEIKEATPKTSPSIRLDETDQNDVRVGDEWILLNKHQNATLPFEFVRLKDQYRICELGCGEIVNNQVVEKRLCSFPMPHWRTRCNSCDCFVSPDGQGFIKGGAKVQSAFKMYFTELKRQGKIIEKEPVKADRSASIQDCGLYTEISTNNHIIRKYK